MIGRDPEAGYRAMLELAELVLLLTGSDSRIEFLPLPKDDPTRRRPNITRARAVLGWEPKVEVIDGLGHTIDWFRQILNVRPAQSVEPAMAVA